MRISAITCKRSNGKRTTERRRKREKTGEPEDRGAAGIQTDRDRGTQAEQQQDREQQREQSNEEEGKESSKDAIKGEGKKSGIEGRD
jgi:hypothetical protein